MQYTAKALYSILANERHEVPWPSETLDFETEAVLVAFKDRLNHASSLYQMVGHIADIVTFDMPTPGNEDFSARYYYDVPVHYHRTLVPRESQLASMVAVIATALPSKSTTDR